MSPSLQTAPTGSEQFSPPPPAPDNAPHKAPESAGRDAIADLGPADQACALASRLDLDERLVAALAQRPERDVVHALARNSNARLGRKILRGLMERGRADPILARILLCREDLHLCHLRLFMQADAEERAHLIAIASRSSLARTRRNDSFPRPDAGQLARLELCALQRHSPAFHYTLAHLLSCDASMARRIAEDKGGEALALALVALRMPAENAARIFLTGFPEIGGARQKFCAIMRIVNGTPRRAATGMIRTIIEAYSVTTH
jgi:uncharacterized protein (DUF2336 family)